MISLHWKKPEITPSQKAKEFLEQTDPHWNNKFHMLLNVTGVIGLYVLFWCAIELFCMLSNATGISQWVWGSPQTSNLEGVSALFIVWMGYDAWKRYQYSRALEVEVVLQRALRGKNILEAAGTRVQVTIGDTVISDFDESDIRNRDSESETGTPTTEMHSPALNQKDNPKDNPKDVN